jgi:hypothetical protein
LSNRIVGMTYDALGHLINDGLHTYTGQASSDQRMAYYRSVAGSARGPRG